MSTMKRKKNNKSVKIVIGSIICLLLIMTVGYAAFSTKLNIAAKGNVKVLNAANLLQKSVVSAGDGLYEESGTSSMARSISYQYIFKGENPNNYIEFNNELWRIVSVKPDETLKIVKAEPLADTKVWNDTKTLDWTNSSLNKFLNDNYYNTFNDENKKQIINSNFNIGAFVPKEETPITKEDIQKQEEQQKLFTKIGLLNISDYLKASSNENCLNFESANEKTLPCKDKNYLYKKDKPYMLINPSETGVWNVKSVGNLDIIDFTTPNNVIPVINLKAEISLSGDGTETNPYKIKNLG